ncbi:PglD-related sugar-binding protein [Chitinophaga rhizophila]|uniref:PglD N-terminal domain-containing protein n=1 Tax=Chitinophaga rhizophila TaxID=2866212 RepID=A0ABS7GJE9_9BACT|nr:hypothetical protein [Chitinophaga rhizophila]MBW8687345.1 hypothetical protein [Chitinophaga rhizophila]
METCLIYGTGGHALTVEELAIKEGYRLIAYFDDNVKVQQQYRDRMVLKYDSMFNHECPVIIAIGNNAARKRIAAIVAHRYCTLKDQSAIISKTVYIGKGTVVMPGSVIQADVQIGPHCILNIGSAVDHEVQIGAFVHVGPKVYIGGGAVIGEGANIGAGTIVMRNAVVPPWTDVPPNRVVI